MTTRPSRAADVPLRVPDLQLAQRLDPRDFHAFTRVCPDRPVARGATVFRAGDPATHLHVVARGQFKLVAPTPDGKERIVALCGPGDLFGEAFLADQATYRVDAVALSDGATCPMSLDDYRRLALEAPGFVVGFTQVVVERLLQCREHLARVEAPIRARVAAALLEQARRFGRDEGDGWWSLATDLRHEDLGALIGATRVSVTTAVASLRGAGVLLGTRGRYRLHEAGFEDAAEAVD